MPLLPKGGQMAIRSLLMPQSRINAQCSVADLDNDLSQRDSSRPADPSRCKARIRRAAMLAGLSLVILGSSGCSSLYSGACRSIQKQDMLNDFMISHRNRVMAAKAWHCQKHTFCNPSSAFQDGFYAGYAEVASGGNGCIPAVAPAKYWGWMYQSASGTQAVNDWFAGYPMGVKAAEQDGVGHWNNVGTARMPSNMNQTPPAMLPVGAAPVLLDNNDPYSQPTDLTSPFVDDLPQPATNSELNGLQPKSSNQGSGLKDALELGPHEGAMMSNQNDGAVSFSASSSDIPELEPRRSQKMASKDSSSIEMDTADLNSVIDSIFGPGPEATEQPAAAKSPAAKSATKQSATDLPFSFQ
ncbi:hypothetical protein Q31b_31130 [Novipirellula aureliae]|uniref:Uncharacterized protein n=1 Tax=Novipirellula aureliae TaxID=2527966 RepID=A0A5C6E3B3_9BACT|nr:hypothetical protein [Novipirellula aureliae]TWU41659.1 hypothetical protein Q31b_31130 [Novipirellula aureliae]